MSHPGPRLAGPSLQDHLGDLNELAVERQKLESKSIETSLLPFLRDILRKFKEKTLDWKSQGYNKLYTNALTQYIESALGAQPHVLKKMKPASVGYGCPKCRVLDSFLAAPERETLDLEEYAKDRSHLESRLALIRIGISFTESRGPKGDHGAFESPSAPARLLTAIG